MDYLSFLARLANTAVYDAEADPDFAIMAPQALEYAENRILRELDPIQFRQRREGLLELVNGGFFSTSTLGDDIVCVRDLWWYDDGWRPISRRDTAFLRLYQPVPSVGGVPRYWATEDGVLLQIVAVPPADAALEIDLTYRPPGMTEANPVTWLGTWVPELLFAAAMVFACGFQRSFGEAQASGADGISWESQYKALFAGAAVEARRRKGDGPFDNSMVPAVGSIAPT